MALLTKANTIITFEGSRLQPRDMLDTSQPTHVRSLVIKVNLTNGLTKVKSLEPGIGGHFIVKGHITDARAVP